MFLPLLPAGLYELLADLGVRLVEVPEAEYPTLGCNVLAVRPGVVVVAEGNDGTRRGLEAAGVRGARDPARRGGRERLRRRDLPDAADPARVSRRRRSPSAAGAAADAVDAAIRRDLEDLVRIPSVTGDEDAIAANLADRLESLGLEVEVFHPDPAAIRDDPDWPGEEVPRSTAPGRARSRRARRAGGAWCCRATWTSCRPAIPRRGRSTRGRAEVRGGRLFGRGACDMKGGVAAILGAVRALRGAGTLDALAGELVVALVPSEEDGGQGTLAAIRAGATGDLAIIAEPSGLDIVVAHAGAITFRLTVPGRAAHASRRTRGRVRAGQPAVARAGARGRRGGPQRRRDRPR